MNRVVYIGGFGNGKSSAEGVGEALTAVCGYDDAEVFTYANAKGKERKQLRRALRGATRLVTHSAGLEAIDDSMAPLAITAFDAPLPTSVPHLVLKTVVKTARMHAPMFDIETARDGSMKPVYAYDRSAIAEMLTHPNIWNTYKQVREIARFDAIFAAADFSEAQIPTELVYATGDDYFQIDASDIECAAQEGVPLYMIEGQHDELVLRPEAVLHSLRVQSEFMPPALLR